MDFAWNFYANSRHSTAAVVRGKMATKTMQKIMTVVIAPIRLMFMPRAMMMLMMMLLMMVMMSMTVTGSMNMAMIMLVTVRYHSRREACDRIGMVLGHGV